METFLAVLSFPFWFIGSIFIVGAIFNGVKIKDKKATLTERLMVFIVGLVLLIIAKIMVG